MSSRDAESDTPDAALIQALRRGDEAAFELLFERFARLLSQRIQRRIPPRLRRRISVADVLQETRLAAHLGLGRLAAEDVEGLRAWLVAIADKKAIDLQRRHDGAAQRTVRREVTRSGRPETGALPGRQASPSQVAMAAETAELARLAAEGLPADYREVIRLVREEGLSLKETAPRMGRSYAATRQLYGRAFCRFKALFDELRGRTHG